MSRRRYKQKSRQVPLINLSDYRKPAIASKSPRNWLWRIVSLPFRIWMWFWNWLMESKPKGNRRRMR